MDRKEKDHALALFEAALVEPLPRNFDILFSADSPKTSIQVPKAVLIENRKGGRVEGGLATAYLCRAFSLIKCHS